jgi:signal recognition particle GTPase
LIRAAASQQLTIWGQLNNIKVITREDKRKDMILFDSFQHIKDNPEIDLLIGNLYILKKLILPDDYKQTLPQ